MNKDLLLGLLIGLDHRLVGGMGDRLSLLAQKIR